MGLREGRGWGCLAGAGRWLSGRAAPPGPLAGVPPGLLPVPTPPGVTPGSGPGHRELQRAWVKAGARLFPCRCPWAPASPQRRGAGPVLCGGTPYLGTAAWPAGTLRLCGRGRQRAGARRPAAPAGEGGSGGRAREVRAGEAHLPETDAGICAALGSRGRPGSPGQGPCGGQEAVGARGPRLASRASVAPQSGELCAPGRQHTTVAARGRGGPGPEAPALPHPGAPGSQVRGGASSEKRGAPLAAVAWLPADKPLTGLSAAPHLDPFFPGTTAGQAGRPAWPGRVDLGSSEG